MHVSCAWARFFSLFIMFFFVGWNSIHVGWTRARRRPLSTNHKASTACAAVCQVADDARGGLVIGLTQNEQHRGLLSVVTELVVMSTWWHLILLVAICSDPKPFGVSLPPRHPRRIDLQHVVCLRLQVQGQDSGWPSLPDAFGVGGPARPFSSGRWLRLPPD